MKQFKGDNNAISSIKNDKILELKQPSIISKIQDDYTIYCDAEK